MRRAFLMAVATMSLLGADAMADNFTFSFTGTTGTGATGTVTGEIFGLQNDGMVHAATEVLITSYPASFGVISDLIATDWSDQMTNEFTETGGKLTGAEYGAQDNGVPSDPLTPFLVLSIPPTPSLLATTKGSLLAPATFSAVPEPSAWILLLSVMLAAAIIKRSRRHPHLRCQ